MNPHNQNQKNKEELLFINVKTYSFKTYSRVKRENNNEKRTKPDEHEKASEKNKKKSPAISLYFLIFF